MRPLRTLARATATTTAATACAIGIAVATAPAAHAGCVDDYLAGGHTYVGPAIVNPVTVSGGVVTVDTNAAVADATNTVTFVKVVEKNEVRNAGDLVNCIA